MHADAAAESERLSARQRPFATGERPRHDLRLPAASRPPPRAGPTAPTSSSSGSGIAGLTAALRLRERVDRVLLVTKTCSATGSTQWAQGGIAAALDPGDTPEEHLHDTLVAGRRASATSRPSRRWSPRGPTPVRELIALGAEFDRDAERRAHADPRGRPPPRPDRPRRRRRHRRGDLAGPHRRAGPRCVDDPGIEVIEHALVVDLLPATTARVCGVTLHVIGEGQLDGVGAAHGRAVVLATGGLGQVYSATTNPLGRHRRRHGGRAARRRRSWPTWSSCSSTRPCCGSARARSGQQPLISEAVRGEGAFLVDGDGRALHAGPSTSWPTSRRATWWPRRSSTGCARPAPTTSGSTPGTSGAAFLERALPLDRRALPRARLRPGDRADPGRAGPALRLRRGRAPTCDGRSSLAGPLRVRRGRLHRRARRQPARLQLAARGAGLRAPHRRRHHRRGSAAGELALASPAEPAGPRRCSTPRSGSTCSAR